MGLLPEITRKGYRVQELRVVNRAGEKISGSPVDAFTRITRGRFITLPRGDLAVSIFGLLEGKVETIFGDSVARIDQTNKIVHVAFESGAEHDFDLVVGADGLHSRVREIVFGPENRFEKYLGSKVAAFEVALQAKKRTGQCALHRGRPASSALYDARRPHFLPVYVRR